MNKYYECKQLKHICNINVHHIKGSLHNIQIIIYNKHIAITYKYKFTSQLRYDIYLYHHGTKS